MNPHFKPKEKDPKTLLIFQGEEVWREVSKSLFSAELKKLPAQLSWEEFIAHFAVIEQKVARRYALMLLSGRALLSSQLVAKLVAKGISSQTACEVVQVCKEHHYVDDGQETARLVARELKKGRSARAVLCKLQQKKGICQQTLRAHLEHAAPLDRAALERWMAKHGHKVDRSDPAALRKCMAKLCRQGFAPELVFSAFDYNA